MIWRNGTAKPVTPEEEEMIRHHVYISDTSPAGLRFRK